MLHIRNQVVRCAAIFAVLSGTFISCGFAIRYFYGLHGAATLWPYKSLLEQYIVIFRTALICTIASSWSIWFGARRAGNPRSFALWAAPGIFITLILYGVAGCGAVLGGDSKIAEWNLLTHVIFPSNFFSEYNFLTFIFEVAPTTAIAEVLLLYLFSRSILRTNGIAGPLASQHVASA